MNVDGDICTLAFVSDGPRSGPSPIGIDSTEIFGVRVLFLLLGGLFVVIAVAGIVLPVLPTTPFLLLASFFFLRSSPALDEKLRRSPLFGPFLEDWRKYGGVRLHVKITALSTMAIVVALGLLRDGLSPTLRIALVVLAAIGATVVLRLKTIRDPA
jgi:uncharacterized protein